MLFVATMKINTMFRIFYGNKFTKWISYMSVTF